ncbi:hypothetical protein BGW39_008826 [Mortierella sp. 14UC]|nr:hypothetical protein BGW39_008826 [Mortierella sp. 14UC]
MLTNSLRPRTMRVAIISPIETSVMTNKLCELMFEIQVLSRGYEGLRVRTTIDTHCEASYNLRQYLWHFDRTP